MAYEPAPEQFVLVTPNVLFFNPGACEDADLDAMMDALVAEVRSRFATTEPFSLEVLLEIRSPNKKTPVGPSVNVQEQEGRKQFTVGISEKLITHEGGGP
jgi:hypothetical protein